MGKASKRKQRSLKKKGAGVSINAEASPFGRYATAVAFFLIAVTALLIYSNTFFSSFQFDDLPNIVKNFKLRDPSNLWPPSGTRYMAYLSFAVNYYAGGLDVVGYHVVNTAIHVINGLLVYWLVLLTFKTPLMERSTGDTQFKYFVALTSALIFICHPVHTQAVTYITQRFTSLATLFYLLSLALFVKWRLSQGTLNPGFRTVIYVASVLSAVLAMKTKEISFTLPFIIVLYEFAFFDGKAREKILHIAPFVLTLPVIPLTLFLPGGGGGGGGGGIDIAEVIRKAQVEEFAALSRHDYLVTQIRVVVTYIRLLFFPAGQSLDYDYPVYDSFFNPEVVLSFMVLVSVFGLAVYLFIRSRRTGNWCGLLASFGILWFFITLSVESSIIPIKDVIFEHRLYLPSVGIIAAFTACIFYALGYARRRLSPRAPLIFLTGILLLLVAVPLGAAAFKRNLVWKDAFSLWQDVVKKQPGSARGHQNLGSVYDNLGMRDKAIEEFKTAIELKPDYAKAHNNLGLVYYNKGLLDDATEEFREAVKLKPDFAEAYNNLGLAYYGKSLLDDAIDAYWEALRLKPGYARAHNNLGLAYYGKGLIEKAAEEYKQAIRFNSDFAEAHNNLGTIYDAKGQNERAAEEYRTAIRLKYNFVEAHYNLGAVYEKMGLREDAVRELEKALEIRPGYEKARKLLRTLGAR